ncbi:hypothetical protein ABZ802_31195 [Streptomyces sp. NPDC047737]|uniref:hypothetical protein n=1 Tax=Streptomyces sp. NPDC047737 TaxID=3155740 RepID=UPI0033E14401
MATTTEAPASSTTAEGPTSHTQNQLAALAKMREPFDASQVSKLPKIWCSACSKAQFKVCDNPQHKRERCDVCAGNMTSAHLHLDYVGHAELTGRLLEADPLWTWEPLVFGPDGLPKFDNDGGLWIRLTVAGHTRLGYGDAQGKKGPNAVKEAIGDALRNAGMRFGAALALWSKTDMDEAAAEKKNLSAEPSREDRLEELYALMQKRWGHLEGLRAVKVQVGEESFHESRVQDENSALRTFGDIIDDRIRQLIDTEKAQRFMKALPWTDAAGLESSIEDARTKGLSDAMVLYGDPKVPTRVEDVLRVRIAELRPTGGQGEQSGPGGASQPPANGPDPIDQLMSQAIRNFANHLELTKLLAEAGRRNQMLREVDGPAGGTVQFGAMLTARIAELKQQERQSEQNAHADDHQRSAA